MNITRRISFRKPPEELLRVDIIKLYESLTGNPVKARGVKTFALCPFHNDTHPTNFVLYPETNSFYCFACSLGGDAYTFIQKIRDCDFKEALSLAKEYGI